MSRAAFELVFMLVILKIPVIYLCAVVWWAVRAEPRPPEGAARLVEPVGGRPSGGRHRSPRRPFGPRPASRGPHGGPIRTYARRGMPSRARIDR